MLIIIGSFLSWMALWLVRSTLNNQWPSAGKPYCYLLKESFLSFYLSIYLTDPALPCAGWKDKIPLKSNTEPNTCRATWERIQKNWPFVEVEAFSEEQELFIPLLEEVSGSGHLWLAGILADAGKVYLLFLHVVAQPDVVKVRRDVDQSVGHNGVPILRQHLI